MSWSKPHSPAPCIHPVFPSVWFLGAGDCPAPEAGGMVLCAQAGPAQCVMERKAVAPGCYEVARSCAEVATKLPFLGCSECLQTGADACAPSQRSSSVWEGIYSFKMALLVIGKSCLLAVHLLCCLRPCLAKNRSRSIALRAVQLRLLKNSFAKMLCG